MGNAKKGKEYLPMDKQYLVTKNGNSFIYPFSLFVYIVDSALFEEGERFGTRSRSGAGRVDQHGE